MTVSSVNMIRRGLRIYCVKSDAVKSRYITSLQTGITKMVIAKLLVDAARPNY